MTDRCGRILRLARGRFAAARSVFRRGKSRPKRRSPPGRPPTIATAPPRPPRPWRLRPPRRLKPPRCTRPRSPPPPPRFSKRGRSGAIARAPMRAARRLARACSWRAAEVRAIPTMLHAASPSEPDERVFLMRAARSSAPASQNPGQRLPRFIVGERRDRILRFLRGSR